MDKKEAMLILEATRPNGQDVAHPTVAEVLSFVETDPELKSWWDARQSFDRKVATRLQEIPVPENLRSDILAAKTTEPAPSQPLLLPWLAIAALVAILCVAGTLRQITMNTGPIPRAQYSALVLPMVQHHAPTLAMTSGDRDKLVAWLRTHDAPTGDFPQGMAGLPSVGCQKYQIHGHTVSLVCFTMANGDLAHLFVVERSAITDPGQNNSPDYRQEGTWATASWSDDRMTYLLATTAGPDALKQLL